MTVDSRATTGLFAASAALILPEMFSLLLSINSHLDEVSIPESSELMGALKQVLTPEECDVYRSRTKEAGTLLGVRCSASKYLNKATESRAAQIQKRRRHCTPKGVRNLWMLENYKHRTPPE